VQGTNPQVTEVLFFTFGMKPKDGPLASELRLCVFLTPRNLQENRRS
jgi:hypothetical protein